MMEEEANLVVNETMNHTVLTVILAAQQELEATPMIGGSSPRRLANKNRQMITIS